MNRNLTVFTPEFHILDLLPNQTWILSLSNSLDHIYHLDSPFSLPTLFFDGSAQSIDLVCQRIVTGSVGHSVAAGGFGPGGIGNSSVVVSVCSAVECMGCSAGGAEHLAVIGLANHHPVFFYIFTNGEIQSPSTFFFYLLQCHSSTGDHCFMGLCLNF